MPQRHSKNNNDLAYFTYDEKKKLGYGTQRERLGKDSIKPFDACSLCLKPFIDPMCCHKGHVFCRECILECILAQKKDRYPKIRVETVGADSSYLLGPVGTLKIAFLNIAVRVAAHTSQKKQDKDEEEERLLLQKARELDDFDQQNHSAMPRNSEKNHNQDKSGFHGANSVKATSFEEEALRTMKAFWLPSATPAASVRVDAPETHTVCPEGKEKLKLKNLFAIRFTEDNSEEEENKTKSASSSSYDKAYICPSCKVTLTNTIMSCV
ncbi:PREDICTED: nitric oxide synthase-interacting protein-like [Camelina sativa]|uniref:Nitric oxide synthase-interacting protein-like n=1 Tax=Camelina sativa TaxID=90675 RepID=A0ABM1Q7L1_CAMSA|nr:PREDICTED: nitric oxide synthase-interacting protein-like [Camelina sativa]